MSQPVYIVDHSRTPFLKARAKLGPFSASDLAVASAKHLLLRQSFDATDIDKVVTGCTMPSENEANIARVIALRLGCKLSTPAYTVQRNCASGLQAIDNARQAISCGDADLVLAIGTEAMSRAPLLLNSYMANWLAAWFAAKQFAEKVKLLSRLRPSFFVPVIALLKGLTDPIVNLSMGQTAENLAYRFAIDRQMMDSYALQSHQRLAKALDNQHCSITELFDRKGLVYSLDDGVRPDSSLEKLAKLKPFFDKKFGQVTPGNSSQITDGAATLLLASEQAVKKHQLKPLAEIKDLHWAGLDPAQMGLGPVYAMTPILQRQQLSLEQLDCIEINEAFAAQVLACVAAWQDKSFCQQELNHPEAVGKIDSNKLNIDGGAIACGHPVGASGARITMQAVNQLQRQSGRYGMASLCIGGGQGGAILLERV